MPSKRSVKNLSKGKTKKRPLNEFFKKMLKAKKEGAKSFKYKRNTYLGRKHPKLGMVYKKK